MNNVLVLADKLASEQFETELNIYNAMCDQLIKECFLEMEGVVLEGATLPVINTGDDDKHKTLKAIGNWFARIINKIRSRFLSRNLTKMIDKIMKSKRFNGGEKEDLRYIDLEEKISGLLPDDDWFNDFDVNIKRVNTYIDALLPNGTFNIGVFLDPAKARELGELNKTIEDVCEDLHDDYDDLKSIFSSVGDQTKHRSGRKAEVAEMIKSIDDFNESFKKNLDNINKNVPEIKKLAKQIGERNQNNKAGANSISAAFIQILSNLGKALIYIASIYNGLITQIYMTIGSDKLSKED